MAFIKQFIPTGFGVTPEIVEFNTQEELLDIPFVKKFRVDYNGDADEFFYQYSLTPTNILMVEADGGKFYYTVGFITGRHNLNFPKWIPNEKNPTEFPNSIDITQ